MDKTLVDFILDRAKEPSTYAGLGALLAGIHLSVSGDMLNMIVGVVTAVAGLVGVILKEKGLA